MIFLIHYDRAAGKLVEIRRFADSERQRANEERLELEIRLNRQQLEREVVLLDAVDELALRRTHRRYFENLQSLGSASSTPA